MRKILLGIWGAIVALFGLFGVQIGLVADINEVGVVAALLIIGVWLFMEFKQDWADFKGGLEQSNSWKDPAFWTATIASVLMPLLGMFGVTLSDTIISVAALLLSVLVPLFIKPASPISTRKLMRKI